MSFALTLGGNRPVGRPTKWAPAIGQARDNERLREQRSLTEAAAAAATE